LNIPGNVLIATLALLLNKQHRGSRNRLYRGIKTLCAGGRGATSSTLTDFVAYISFSSYPLLTVEVGKQVSKDLIQLC